MHTTGRIILLAAFAATTLLVATIPIAAEEEGSSDAPTPSRPMGSTLTLRVEGGGTMTETTAGLPYVSFYDGPVMAPGETMTVRFAPGEALGDSKFVRIAKADAAFAHGDGPAALLKGAPPGTMIITYAQEVDSLDMVIRIDHNLPHPVAYDVNVERFREGQWAADMTTTCPVPVGVPQIRRWADPMKRIFFHRFHYVADAEAAKPCG